MKNRNIGFNVPNYLFLLHKNSYGLITEIIFFISAAYFFLNLNK